MRSVISISLPRQLAQTVKATVATGQYGSQSEFFRLLLRHWFSNTSPEDTLPLTRRRSLT